MTDNPISPAYYLMLMAVISAVAIFLAQETSKGPLAET